MKLGVPHRLWNAKWARILGLSVLVLWTGTPMAETRSSEIPVLESAIMDRDVERVRRTVATGVDIDEPGFRDQTPVLLAAKIETWDIVLYLIGEGADVASADRDGQTLSLVARGSSIHPDAPEYRDLEAVRAILRERGLY